MRRLCLLIFVLLPLFGCASDGEKHWWDEALKDARGDNMKMGNYKPSMAMGN